MVLKEKNMVLKTTEGENGSGIMATRDSTFS